jgi:hypothetical protein
MIVIVNDSTETPNPKKRVGKRKRRSQSRAKKKRIGKRKGRPQGPEKKSQDRHTGSQTTMCHVAEWNKKKGHEHEPKKQKSDEKSER